MAIDILYRTTDGETFKELTDAQAHEKEIGHLVEFYNRIEAYNDEGQRVCVEDSEAFLNDVWSIEFHSVEELNTLRNILNVEQDICVAPYHEHKGLVYVWNEGYGFISLYDWFKSQASEMLPNDKVDELFPY